MQTQILKSLHNKLAVLPKTKLTLDADVLTVDSEARGVDDITLDWALFFGTPELGLYSATLEPPTENGNVILRGTARLLRYEEIPLRVTFFLSERAARDESATENPGLQAGVRTHLECLIEAERFPDTWELARSYPDMPGFLDFSPQRLGDGVQPSVLRHVDLRECDFVYSSLDFARVAERRRRAFLREESTTLPEPPRQDGRLLERGLNFRAQLAQRAPVFDTALTLLLPQLGVTSVLPVYGSAARQTNGLYLHLYHDLVDRNWSLLSDGRLNLRLERVGLVSGLAGLASGAPAYQIDAVLGDPEDLAFEVSIFKSWGSRRFTLEGAFADGEVFAIDRVLGLLGQGDLLQSLPPALQKVGDIGLRYLLTEINFADDPTRPQIDRLNLRLSSAEAWEVLPDKIAFQPLIQWNAQFPFDQNRRRTEVQIGGTCGIGATDFEVLVLPATKDVMVNMAVGSRFDAGAVLAKLFPGLPFPDVTVLDLDLSANLETGDFMAAVDTITDLNFSIGGGDKSGGAADLRITGIEFNVESVGGNISGMLRGELEVAGYAATVEFALADEWTATVVLPELPVSDLADQFLGAITLPVELPELNLRDVTISVSPKSGAFAINAASDTPLNFGENLSATFTYFEIRRELEARPNANADATNQLTAKQYTSHAMLGIDLRLGELDLQLNAIQAGVTISGDAVWTYRGATNAGETLALRDLLAAANALTGTNLIDPRTAPDLTFSDLQLTFTPKTKAFEFLGKVATPLPSPFGVASGATSGGGNDLTFEIEIRSLKQDERTATPSNAAQARQPYDALLRARTKIAGSDASLSAFVAKDIEWRATIASVTLAGLASEFGLDHVPKDLLARQLRNLDLRFTPKTNAYYIEGEVVTDAGAPATYKIFDELPLAVGDLRIQIRKLPPAPAQVRFSGSVALGALRFQLDLETGAQFFARASQIPRLSAGAFVRPLFGGLLNNLGPAAPAFDAFLNSLALENAAVTIAPGAGTIAVSGTAPGFRAIELRAGRRPTDQKWSFALGASPAEDFSFRKHLGEFFAIFDQIEKTGVVKISQSALLLSPETQTPAARDNQPTFDAVSVPGNLAPAGGISIATPLDFSGTPIAGVFGVSRLNVLAVIGNPGDFYFATQIARGAKSELFEFGPLEIRVKTFPPALGLSGSFALKLIDPTQTLQFQLAGDMGAIGGELEARLTKWTRPYGVPGIEFRDVLLRVLPLPGGAIINALAADVVIGKTKGSVGFQFNKKNPTQCAALLEFNQLSLAAILSAFAGKPAASVLSFTEVIQLRDVAMQVVPVAFEKYNQGVRMQAAMRFGPAALGLTGNITGKLDTTRGAQLTGTLDAFALKPFLSISGVGKNKNPGVQLELGPADPHLALQGELKLLGLPAGAGEARIDTNGLSFEVKRDVGIFKIRLKGTLDDFYKLSSSGTYDQKINVRVPALSIKSPVIGKVPVWPAFTLSAGLTASLAITGAADQDLRVSITQAGFVWSDETWSVPDVTLRLKSHDLTDLPEAIHDHILKNIEQILKKLIDAVRRQFEDVVGQALDAAQKVLAQAIDIRANAAKAADLALDGLDLGVDLSKATAEELERLGEKIGSEAVAAANAMASAAEAASREVADAAAVTAKVMAEQITKVAKKVRSALKKLQFWNW